VDRILSVKVKESGALFEMFITVISNDIGICCWIFKRWEKKGSRGDFILYVDVLVTHSIFNFLALEFYI
jgi:hypothetical protein